MINLNIQNPQKYDRVINGVNIDLVARVLAVRREMVMKGIEPTYKQPHGIQRTVTVKDKNKK